MPRLVGFSRSAALLEEQISETAFSPATKRRSYGAGPASMSSRTVTEFRIGSEQRVCGQGDVVVISGGTEHEAWFREDTEVIDFFAPPREDFLLGGKPAYMSEG